MSVSNLTVADITVTEDVDFTVEFGLAAAANTEIQMLEPTNSC